MTFINQKNFKNEKLCEFWSIKKAPDFSEALIICKKNFFRN